MTLFEHLKGSAYRFRSALHIIGWMWFCLGAVWMAAAGIYKEDAIALVAHAAVDTVWGLGHLYLANKAERWKEFS